MRVFLSWSGERSRLVATALRKWLPMVLNNVSPFVSSDINAGTRWLIEIATELESTDFGIICVTAENQRMPWLNFEASALAKAVNTSRVIPLAINLRPAEIQNPLGQFQSQEINLEGITEIVSSLNSALPHPLPPSLIERITTKWWPDLKKDIDEIDQKLDINDGVEKEVTRTDRELMEDILNSVRGLARIATPPRSSLEGWGQYFLPSSGESALIDFDASTAAKLANMTPEQLDLSEQLGLVVPSIQIVADSESGRFYSFKDVLILKVVKQLSDARLPTSSIRLVVEHLNRRPIKMSQELTLFTDGTTVYEATSPEEIVDLIMNDQDLFKIAVSGAIREIITAASSEMI